MHRPTGRRFCFILRSALSLNFAGFEHPIGTEPSVRQGLRIVLKCIWKRIGARVDNVQNLRPLVQGKCHLGTMPNDRSGLHVSAYPHAFPMHGCSHLSQLRNGLVIRFGLGYAADRKPDQRPYDQDHQDPKIYIGFHTVRDCFQYSPDWSSHSPLPGGLIASKLKIRNGLATSLKHLTPSTRIPADSRRVLQLAGEPALVEANRWLLRERSWIIDQHIQVCRIPAPTFFEASRAEWFRDQLAALGWSAWLDRAGNVLATFGDAPERALVVSAHLDTVFSPQRPADIQIGPDGRLLGPGVSDNGSGLAAILTLARLTVSVPGLQALAQSILLVANVGEEGEGNLSGMRYLCRQPAKLSSVKGFLVLDGPSVDHITTQALGSRRFDIAFTGPGGHSWNDCGTPNPVHALSHVIAAFTQAADSLGTSERHAASGRFSCNFGIIEGGASINSIPSSARAKLDLRSEESTVLEELATLLNSVVERSLERENRGAGIFRPSARLNARIKDLGSRPGGRLSSKSPLLETIQAVDLHLNIRSRVDCASTDANVPLSLGLPAVSIGSGGLGGGAHTSDEWYSPEGREVGLSRILLILSALAQAETPPA